VLKVNKVQSNMMLSLVSYGPSYVSPNVTVGKDEALKFFPEDYKPQEEVVVEPEKKKKRVSFRLKNSLSSYSRIRVLIHFSCRARRVKISESRWKRRPQQQRLLSRLLLILLPNSSNHTFDKSPNSFFSYQIVCPIVKIFKCNLLKYIKKFWFCKAHRNSL